MYACCFGNVGDSAKCQTEQWRCCRCSASLRCSTVAMLPFYTSVPYRRPDVHPIQEASLDFDVPQSGYGQPGRIIAPFAKLRRGFALSDADLMNPQHLEMRHPPSHARGDGGRSEHVACMGDPDRSIRRVGHCAIRRYERGAPSM
jgi:hypothetical protein